MNRPRKLSKIMLGQSGKVDPTLKSDEEKKTVLVFGATGMVGGAVARALLSYPWFRVRVATRRPWCTDAMLLNRAGARVVEADFNYKQSLLDAMYGVKCVFLHTHFWENFSSSLESEQGRNVVDAAVEAGVEHLVYDGTNYVKPDNGRVCSFFQSRLEIEDYLRKTNIHYTVVVLPFYFEHFLTVFRPHEVSPDLFALPLAMDSRTVPCACLNDLALCICKLILQSKSMEGEKIYLAVEMLSVNQMAYHFNREIPGKRFFDPEISVEDFMSFDFPGSKDLAAIFEYYQQSPVSPDISLTRNLNPRVRSMAAWLCDNRMQLSVVLGDTSDPPINKPILPIGRRSSLVQDSSESEEDSDSGSDTIQFTLSNR